MNTLLITPLLVFAAALASVPASHASLYRSYDGIDASIDSASWTLSDNSYTFGISAKPAVGTAGLSSPWVSGTEKATSTSKALAFKLDNAAPVDSQNLQKLHYLIISGNNGNAPQVKVPNTRFTGFSVKFDAGYTLSNGPVEPIGTQLWQAWQGSGWPPVQLRTDESSGQIRLYLLMSNDQCRGSLNTYSARRYLKNSSGQDIVFNKGQWYRIVVEIRPDHTTAAQGKVRAYVDNSTAAAVDWTGRFGYTPESSGGQSGTTDGLGVSFGLYQQNTDTNHRVFFDRIKFSDTKSEALPY